MTGTYGLCTEGDDPDAAGDIDATAAVIAASDVGGADGLDGLGGLDAGSPVAPGSRSRRPLVATLSAAADRC